MEKVAIVILNWNGEKMLKEYLPSVLQYSRDEATGYVADNASTDGSLAMLRGNPRTPNESRGGYEQARIYISMPEKMPHRETLFRHQGHRSN